MMENAKIGPYRLIDYDANKGSTILFASIHTDIQAVIKKINHLYQMYVDVNNNLSVDFLSYLAVTSTNSFDTSQLIDFHETLLMEHAIPVKKIKPLTINPGCLMITDRRLYFQPAQLNNVGDTVQHFDLQSISKVYKRRYLLQHTCFEVILYVGGRKEEMLCVCVCVFGCVYVCVSVVCLFSLFYLLTFILLHFSVSMEIVHFSASTAARCAT
jgi:factor associated with neutral sphingomyelinase activation